MVVVGRLDQKMPGPIFCPSPALDIVDILDRNTVINKLVSKGLFGMLVFCCM